jgi:high-affinity iron transporter
MRVFRVFSVLILLVVAGSALATPQVQTLWRLLDYIAVDYPGAVSGGAVISQVEYDEMTEFSATVREGIAGLPAHPSTQALEAQAVTLQDAIADKAAPAEVELQARALAEALLGA